MALSDTITAINCVPICDTQRVLDDPAFLDWVINALLEATGIDIADLTAADLQEATELALCAMQDRVVFSTAAPESKKAIILFLLTQFE